MVEMNLAGQFHSSLPSLLPPPYLRKTICSFLAFYSGKDQRGSNDWMAPSALRGRWESWDHSARVGSSFSWGSRPESVLSRWAVLLPGGISDNKVSAVSLAGEVLGSERLFRHVPDSSPPSAPRKGPCVASRLALSWQPIRCE